MKTDKNILLAFLLNISFSIFEFFGGLFTGSVAILSDSIHDMGDALSIGLSYLLERKSKKKPDYKHTYGYIRYSVMGSVITTSILVFGSVFVIYKSIDRLINPVTINYNGMMLFSVFGVFVNSLATYFTKDGESLNQKAVNLHLFEDVLGWMIVLIGSVIMKFTDISCIDSILSIGVALFILITALKNIRVILDLFLEKTPNDININKLKKELLNVKGIIDIHHIHIRSIDGFNNYATMHVVTKKYDYRIKKNIKDILREYSIVHSTIEQELINEECDDKKCNIKVHLHNHNH